MAEVNPFAKYAVEEENPFAKYADVPAAKAELSGNPLRAGMRTLSPVLSSILENPQGALQAGKQLLMGGARGVKDVIDTGAQWAADGFDKVSGSNQGAKVRAMNEQGKAVFKREYENQVGASIGRVGGQVGVTWPVASLLGAGATVAGLPRLGTALSSGGMTTGGAAPGFVAGLGDVALRAGAGAVTGGAMAGLVDPESAKLGATIGAVAPGVLQIAGKTGGAVLNSFGSKAGQGKVLAQALGASDADIQAIIKAANAAPESLVPNSPLTLAQALQQQGVNQPSVKMLERIAAGGPGGDTLLKRYSQQSAARLDDLGKQGAQTYQGAAAAEADTTGNQLAAYLRTQAGDEKALEGAAWMATNARAADEGAMLQIPTDRMKALVTDRMGDGYTGGTAATSKTIKEAERIGSEMFGGFKPLPQAAINKGETLEQAVRRAGGLRGNSGELRDLGIRQSGTTGMINNKSGQSADLLAEKMYQRGFIPDADPATLFDALRNGAGRKLYAAEFADAGFASRLEQSMGDMPGAERLAKAVPFKSFQTLRSGAGSDAAALSEKAGNEVQSGVMTQFEKLMAGRADDAAAGNLLPGESMSPGLMQDYTAARGLTRDWHERYDGGNAISQILRKPVGQNYTLNGDEVTNKLWHGGSGLVDDVATLKRTLSDNNREPAMNQLRQFIMTDAASKTKASGDLGAALPRYVENRMPGLMEALTPAQFKSVTGVASDVRNADAAASVAGLLGSDSYAKATRAMSGGLLDTPGAKKLATALSYKGLGGEFVRGKLAGSIMQYKGRTVSELMANPKLAAQALKDATFVRSLDNQTARELRQIAGRTAPILAAD